MSYASTQDVIDRFGLREIIALTDRSDPPVDAVDEQVLGRALTDAAAEIDAYIGARYGLPLKAVPQVLVRLACDLARYRLADDADTVTDEVRERYKAAVKLLQAISRGEATLGVAVAEEPLTTDRPQSTGPPRLLSQDALEDF